MRRANIGILALGQFVALAGTSGFALLAGIVGAGIAPTRTLATLPISLVPVSLAAATIPAALFMQRFGRRAGFMLAALAALCGYGLAAVAVARGDFALLCLAALPAGLQGAFAQQYRFAAAESASEGHAARAVSFVLLGGIAAGYAGPALATHAVDLVAGRPYAGSFAALGALYVVAIAAFAFYADARPTLERAAAGGRRLREIVRTPVFVVAAAGAATSYAVMSLVMTASPLQLNQICGYDLASTALVIQSHVMAMFTPSLFSGRLVERFGPPRVMLAGAALLAITLLGSLVSDAWIHYWAALVLLGVGWNLQFVASTLLLTRAYRPEERFRAQAVNDFTVFGVQAAASLSAGALLFGVGWIPLNLVALPLLVPVFVGGWYVDRAMSDER